jgi:hypothetical protein
VKSFVFTTARAPKIVIVERPTKLLAAQMDGDGARGGGRDGGPEPSGRLFQTTRPRRGPWCDAFADECELDVHASRFELAAVRL